MEKEVERRRKKIDIAISPLCFFTTWTESVGKTILYKFLRINKTKKIFLSLKNIFLKFINLKSDI